VVGRPITAAANPEAATEALVSAVAEALRTPAPGVGSG
jgi:orotidine-5'-phosphate decarboxylase